jgi:serine/threonine protein phosphatase PrpC
LILGTDGVFDNLFEEEILQIVANFTQKDHAKTKASAHFIAKLIAEAAYNKSK